MIVVLLPSGAWRLLLCGGRSLQPDERGEVDPLPAAEVRVAEPQAESQRRLQQRVAHEGVLRNRRQGRRSLHDARRTRGCACCCRPPRLLARPNCGRRTLQQTCMWRETNTATQPLDRVAVAAAIIAGAGEVWGPDPRTRGRGSGQGGGHEAGAHQEALLQGGDDLIPGVGGDHHEGAPAQAVVQHRRQLLLADHPRRRLLPINLHRRRRPRQSTAPPQHCS